MSSFMLKDLDPPCKVSLCPDITEKELVNHAPFKQWLETFSVSLKTQYENKHAFRKAPYQLQDIEIQAVDRFGQAGNRIGFLKMRTTVTNDQGEWLPGAVFLRGGSVGMLVILQPDDISEKSDEESYAILTIQPRIAAGSLAFAEIPAGMLDGSTFSGGAAKEIKEETGLEVHESELIDMTALACIDDSNEPLQKAVYSTPGGCDEYIPLFLAKKRIARSQLSEYQGKLTGLRDEGEKITLKLVKLEDLWKEGARDAKTLAAWALYTGLKKENKI